MTKRKWLALLLACVLAFPGISLAQYGEQYTVDFSYMRRFAPNTVGWLYQPDTTIDSPVVYAPEGTFYLNHRYDNQQSRIGSVYMLSPAMPDLTDPVIVLRGQNNWDDTLFGSLSLYQQPEYYQQHPTLYLVSPEGQYRLDIFAGIKARHSDAETWMVSAEETLTGTRLLSILESSFVAPSPALLPEAGDSWAILTTEDAKNEGSRFVLYARKRPVAKDQAPVIYTNLQGPEAVACVSGKTTVEGVGTWMVYGQNDPVWDRMIFEAANSSRRRPFGDGGCGPTSIAIAIANLVPAEKLPQIRAYMADAMGTVFCPCSITQRWCDLGHRPYQLNTPEDYLRYFPLAVADFAMGNNVLGVQGRRDSYGTNMSYLEAICSVYGISVKGVRSLEEALPYLRRKDTMAIACVTGASSPFTNNSHFLVLAQVTDEHIYVLDPMRRESYAALDEYGVLEVLSPGVVRVRLDQAHLCHFSTISLLTY